MDNQTKHPLYIELLSIMKAEQARPAPIWKKSQITPADLQTIKKESDGGPFDTLNIRNHMYNAFADGKAQIFAHESDVGRVLTLTEETTDPTPLEIWGRLMRVFGQANPTKRPQVIWFASRHMREFPAHGQPIEPQHVNGGYCMVCDPGTVVIYRREDATRVLIHELLHGFCTDKPLTATYKTEHLETETEAWAELILAAAREIGIASPDRKPYPFALTAQLQWVALQNEILRNYHGVHTSADYGWRYTIGKEDALRSLGFVPSYIQKRNISMRLTPPIGNNEIL